MKNNVSVIDVAEIKKRLSAVEGVTAVEVYFPVQVVIVAPREARKAIFDVECQLMDEHPASFFDFLVTIPDVPPSTEENNG